MSEAICMCAGDWDLFIWRGDPAWWSCGCCDGRVRRLTTSELADRAFGPLPETIANTTKKTQPEDV